MTILVTGATGNVGRHVVDRLHKAGKQVLALTRNPEKARMPDGVEVVQGDLFTPETLSPVFARADRIFLVTVGGEEYSPLPGHAIIQLAEEYNVQHITVVWSGEKGSVEQAVEASGIAWTQLHPVEFMANAIDWSDSIRAEGVVREAFGNSLSALIHEADIANVAVRTLLENGHTGKTYTLSGPEVLTVREKVQIISAVMERDIQFIELTEKQARARMQKENIPEEHIEMVINWFTDPPKMAYTVVPTVEKITGQPARTFKQWVRDHLHVWKVIDNDNGESDNDNRGS
ncbi:NAD(P)H-binding protein [Natribacillus halophilus]|uniref:Uncharacterized conserved protein YbjT, contains NAD(P)-binding and DUF2867 domains n=1 Tax=Natribacillus halophilus TaxID=549003 RepID=A0A1G8NJC2_9BACI|nr:NAD(P)H-binding protein [Natribacillus halophilus]SDI80207.1 Uncharacterized conserved protein YbjT, contains NAD(P)-binding and DUF2867 domains [Natribacillus halophilus]